MAKYFHCSMLVGAAAACIVLQSASPTHAAISISTPTETFTGIAPDGTVVTAGTALSGTFSSRTLDIPAIDALPVFDAATPTTPPPLNTPDMYVQSYAGPIYGAAPLAGLTLTNETMDSTRDSATSTDDPNRPTSIAEAGYANVSLTNSGFSYVLEPQAASSASLLLLGTPANDTATLDLTTRATVSEELMVANSGIAPTTLDLSFSTSGAQTSSRDLPTGAQTTGSNDFYVNLVDRRNSDNSVLSSVALTDPSFSAPLLAVVLPDSTLSVITTASSVAGFNASITNSSTAEQSSSPTYTTRDAFGITGSIVVPAPEPATFLILAAGGALALLSPLRRRTVD